VYRELARELAEVKVLAVGKLVSAHIPAREETEGRLAEAESKTIRGADATHHNAWREYWRSVTHFDHGRMQPSVALRNAIGVALPLAAGVALGMPLGGLAVSAGALQVSYSDGHSPYAQRAKRMLSATVLCALAVVAGGLTGQNLVLAMIVPSLWAFAAGLAVCLGPTAESLGVISLVTLIIYAAQPLTPQRALLSGLLALGGGLLQTALSLMLWPVRRYQPERRALAALYNQLAQAAIVPTGPEGSPPATEQSTATRETLAGLGYDNTLEAARYWSLLNQAERIRLSLLTLRRLRKRMERDAGRDGEASTRVKAVQQFLDVSARVLAQIGQSLSLNEKLSEAPGQASDEVQPELGELETIAESLRAEETAPSAGSFSAMTTAMTRDARYQMDALVGQLRSAVRSVSETTPAGFEALASRDARQPWPRRITGSLAIVRANLTLQSSAFRHAIRMAMCLAIGEMVAHRLHNGRSYWLAMTIVLVLKQEFATTFTRGLLRIGGTILGLLLATGLFHFLAPGVALKVVLVGILVFLLRWAGAANYGVFTMAVSALIVVMVAFTGVSPKAVILVRGEMTCLGGVIALAAYLAWPTWERTRVALLLAQMLDAYRAYFHAVAEAHRQSNSSSEAGLNRARMAGRLARSNVEASAERLRLEPGTLSHQIALLTAMLANSHRFVRAVMALETVPVGSTPVRLEFRDFAHDVEKTVELLAAALRGHKLPVHLLPDLREDHHRLVRAPRSETARYALVNEETDRMTNSLNTLKEQVLQWQRLQS
jgi:uncharacterized membrane protein YccC